jgi:hypothetical protein
VVNAHILHNKTSKKKMSLEIFYEKVAEGLLASAGTKTQVQGQTSSPAGRLVGRDHFLYRVPGTHHLTTWLGPEPMWMVLGKKIYFPLT